MTSTQTYPHSQKEIIRLGHQRCNQWSQAQGAGDEAPEVDGAQYRTNQVLAISLHLRFNIPINYAQKEGKRFTWHSTGVENIHLFRLILTLAHYFATRRSNCCEIAWKIKRRREKCAVLFGGTISEFFSEQFLELIISIPALKWLAWTMRKY